MDDRQFKASLLPIMVIIFCILIVGIVAGALALNRQRNAVNVLRVPEEYATIQAAIDAASTGDTAAIACAGIPNASSSASSCLNFISALLRRLCEPEWGIPNSPYGTATSNGAKSPVNG